MCFAYLTRSFSPYEVDIYLTAKHISRTLFFRSTDAKYRGPNGYFHLMVGRLEVDRKVDSYDKNVVIFRIKAYIYSRFRIKAGFSE